jgi:hypothetical protein
MNEVLEDDLQRTVASIRDQVDAHLCGRSGTWLASFAELVAMAGDGGVPVGGLELLLTGLRGEGPGREHREALIDALVGRWAAHRDRQREVQAAGLSSTLGRAAGGSTRRLRRLSAPRPPEQRRRAPASRPESVR